MANKIDSRHSANGELLGLLPSPWIVGIRTRFLVFNQQRMPSRREVHEAGEMKQGWRGAERGHSDAQAEWSSLLAAPSIEKPTGRLRSEALRCNLTVG